MFPLTFYPPKYIESVIVCLVDKACSLYETFSKRAYLKISNRIVEDKKERRIIARRIYI